MCVAAGPLLLASAAVTAVGQGLNAAQGAATANYQASIAARNAQLDQENARMSQENTRLQAQRFYRQQGQKEGQQIAAMAANGVDLGSGSALAVQQDTAMIGNEDATQIYRQGDQTARGFDINAFNDNAKVAAAKQAASGAVLKGVFDVGGDILGGASQFAKLKGKAA